MLRQHFLWVYSKLAFVNTNAGNYRLQAAFALHQCRRKCICNNEYANRPGWPQPD
jgi:hypothetical protein